MENKKSELEKIKRNLNLILKKGDLYDVISDKENTSPRKNILVKGWVLCYSRILYIGILICDRIKSFFAPIEEIKKAQDEIRDNIGINIDIIRSKETIKIKSGAPTTFIKRYLGILYENYHLDLATYIEHLKKILTFCELHNINEILLREADINNICPELDTDDFHSELAMEIFSDMNIKNSLNYFFLVLNCEELLKLIQQLEIVNTDQKTLLYFKDQISDITIKNAIQEYQIKGDLDNLKEMVSSRLNLNLNSDNTHKDKIYGKILETIKINDKYVSVTTTSKNGKQISNNITSLYDYLDVQDYNTLLKMIEKDSEHHELYSISALHLYLCEKKKGIKSQEEIDSLYDRIYKSYQEKKQGKIKNVFGIHSKADRFIKNFIDTIISCGISSTLILICLLGGMLNDFAHLWFLDDPNSNMMNSICNMVYLAYQYSYEFEKELVKNIIQYSKDLKKEVMEPAISTIKETVINSNLTGDVSNNNDKNMTVASIVPLQTEICPQYFLDSYATSATYFEGSLKYELEPITISYNKFEEVEPLFQIIMQISKNELKEACQNNELNLNRVLFPVGENYVLTYMYIVDRYNTNKVLTLDWARVRNLENLITDYEKEILMSMEEPEIHFAYGISNTLENSIEIPKKDNDTDFLSQEVKEAIISGLNLKEDASLEEIYQAIKSKNYSLTPIEDAGLTKKIRDMDELEYFKTIASLDSLICNLAATLAVNINDDLIYTSGYLNTDDLTISTNEAHAWAMTEDGKIVDLTPYGSTEDKEESKNIMNTIISWGKENHIPIYGIILLIMAILNKKFGKKVKLSIKIYQVEHLLNKKEIEESYAKLKEIIYGGTNITVIRDASDLLERINKELPNLNEEELKELKKELEGLKTRDTRDVLNTAKKILNNLSFLKEHEEEIKLSLSKRSKL